jgi:hypothetical protein
MIERKIKMKKYMVPTSYKVAKILTKEDRVDIRLLDYICSYFYTSDTKNKMLPIPAKLIQENVYEYYGINAFKRLRKWIRYNDEFNRIDHICRRYGRNTDELLKEVRID